MLGFIKRLCVKPEAPKKTRLQSLKEMEHFEAQLNNPFD